MLVLSRKKNESIVIDGGIVIEVLQISRDQIRVGVTAPAAVKVLRGELRPFSQQPAASAPNLEGNGQESERTTQFVISGNRLQTGRESLARELPVREIPVREIAVREPEVAFQTNSQANSKVNSQVKPPRGKALRSNQEIPAPRLVRCG
jgi:carbon storage regulator